MILNSSKSTLSGAITIPGSKSHTIRAAVIAALAGGTSILRGPLDSADTRSCISGIQAMGAGFSAQEGQWKIKGVKGQLRSPGDIIDIGNSGTSLRILTAVAALGSGPVSFTGDESIRTRPMEPLLSALQQLGAGVDSRSGGCPLTIIGPIEGGKAVINGISSQFVSALLLACPLAGKDTELIVENLQEKPYVQITLDWLERQGIDFSHQELSHFKIKGGQSYHNFEDAIPADFSSATFSLCAAAVTGSEIIINGLDFNDPQGDKEVFEYLRQMGLTIKHEENGTRIIPGKLTGAVLDLNNTPDALPAMAVVGACAEGQTVLKNVLNARLKECDRIAATCTELRKMGASVTEQDDGLIIRKSTLNGATVAGHDDHRMVMALAIAGMAAAGTTRVTTAEAVSITYPGFVGDMRSLGADIQLDH